MRLFVGVELDERVRDAAAGIAESLRRDLGRQVDARWVPAENLHVTLWFLGEVAESRVEPTLATLQRPFDQAAFKIELSGLGAFPPSGAPRVIWLGVTAGVDALARVHAELTNRLEPIGHEPERRAYSAHLTLARVKSLSPATTPRALRAKLQERPADAGSCRVEAVTVFRSRVSSKGATYEILQRLPLK